LDPLSEEDHIIVDDDVNLDDDDDEEDEIIELQPHSRGSQAGASKHQSNALRNHFPDEEPNPPKSNQSESRKAPQIGKVSIVNVPKRDLLQRQEP
jgi:hypothetical protein